MTWDGMARRHGVVFLNEISPSILFLNEGRKWKVRFPAEEKPRRSTRCLRRFL